MNTAIIDGVKYDIISEIPVTAKGYEDRTNIGLKRPKGKIIYVATRYANGLYSSVTSLGR